MKNNFLSKIPRGAKIAISAFLGLASSVASANIDNDIAGNTVLLLAIIFFAAAAYLLIFGRHKN